MKAISATELTFAEEVLNAPGPVVVEFHARWCQPCKALAPALDTLAGAYAGQVKIVKVDVDEAPLASNAHAIRSVPTLVAFRGGQVVAQKAGGVTLPTLKQFVQAQATAG